MEILEMSTSLDAMILTALGGQSEGAGVLDFSSAQSAINKAEQVLEVVRREGIDPSNVVFVSIGGADGTELEHILQTTNVRRGVLLEYEDRLAEIAREKAIKLREAGKEMLVLIGDAAQKLEPAILAVKRWAAEGEVEWVVVTMHAVLHELPNRGGAAKDLESFLQKFIWQDLSVLAIAREPCMPDDLPPVVYLSANCRPDLLAKLASHIRSKHHQFVAEQEPAPMANSVRMGSRLAVETLVKLFYIESLTYEIEERVTAFTKQELVNAFCNVFGNENVRTEGFQTASVDRFWKALGILLRDPQQRELPRPELHVRVIARWIPESAPGARLEEQRLHLRPAQASSSLPPMRWLDELLELVREGEWVRLEVLPGGGQEEVRRILEEEVPDSSIILLDLAAIRDSDLLFSAIRDRGGVTQLRDAPHTPVLSVSEVAAIAAGPRRSLILVVQGWGTHARLYGRESLRHLAAALQQFRTVESAKVVLVLLSPIPTSHIPGPAPRGSLLSLVTVPASAADGELVMEWGRAHLRHLPPEDLDALMLASYGRVGAMRAAIRTAKRAQNERLQAVHRAHVQSGEAILNEIGPCCYEVLTGNSSAAACIQVLKDAGILDSIAESPAPVIGAWANSWGAEVM
jgi:hypothetical protein